MKFNDSVDDKNIHLLNVIENAGVEIDFEIKPDFTNWAVQPRYKYAIVAPTDKRNPEMLAHELLHIKMNILGFLPSNIIMDIYHPGNCYLSTKAIPNMQNLLAHLKMLPMFVEMGYQAATFVANYGNDFFLKELIPSTVRLRAFYEINKASLSKPSIELVTEFIANIICIISCEQENLITGKKIIDTDYLTGELQAADEDLFDAIYTEVTNWVNSNTYRNYDLYNNLNMRLFKLGYPTEMNWQDWMNDPIKDKTDSTTENS